MPEFRLVRYRGRYAVVYYEGGRRHRHSLGTNDRAQARLELARFVELFHKAQEPQQFTVGWLFKEYVRARDNDRAGYAWLQLRHVFADVLPSQVSEELCQQYVKERGASIGTIHTELGYLRTALKWGEDHGYITKAPKVWRPEKPRPRDRHLTRIEAQRLIAGTSMPHVTLFIVLALTTAGRMGAILDLTWDRVDFHREKIHLDNPVRDRTRKGRATVPMNETARRYLLDAQDGAVSPYVIEWGGEKVGTIKKALARAAERAGVNGVSAHVLRHTAAVWMIENGVPMEEVAQYLGHSSVATTRRIYARFSPSYLRRAAEALELHSDL